MKNVFVKNSNSIEAFSLKQLMFDDSQLVSMQVTCSLEDKLIDTTLLFSFSLFNDLLRLSGNTGYILQQLVSDKLLSNEEQPYIIQCEKNQFVFSMLKLETTFLIENDLSCLNVVSLSMLSFLQQSKNLRSNIKNFSDVKLINNTTNVAIQEIALMYKYYAGLKELNVIEKVAREKAGLQNDNLFKIAYHAATHA